MDEAEMLKKLCQPIIDWLEKNMIRTRKCKSRLTVLKWCRRQWGFLLDIRAEMKNETDR